MGFSFNLHIAHSLTPTPTRDARNGHSTHSTSFFSFLFGFHEILSRAQTQNALKGIPTMLSKQDATLLLLTYVRAHGRFTLLRPYFDQ